MYKGKSIYFVFNVLPFGIASAGHILTKLLTDVVKYRRNQGLKIIMYLDDGLGGASDLILQKKIIFTSKTVYQNLGF